MVRALWLAERRVCMRVCKHGCDVKMFCFPRANHASPNLKKVLSWKTLQVYFISSSVETWKIFRNVLGQFIFSWADILSEENRYFGKHLFFCKTKTDYAYKLRVQDFATGKNFSFNQWFKQESLAFFSGKLFYKRNRKLFSCVCVAWYKHSRGWENSRQLRKTETKSSVCITVSNSPILWDPGAVSRAGRKDATKVFMHTFVAPFNPARLTAPGSPRMEFSQPLLCLYQAMQTR